MEIVVLHLVVMRLWRILPPTELNLIKRILSAGCRLFFCKNVEWSPKYGFFIWSPKGTHSCPCYYDSGDMIALPYAGKKVIGKRYSKHS
jgi:hypothetical protein